MIKAYLLVQDAGTEIEEKGIALTSMKVLEDSEARNTLCKQYFNQTDEEFDTERYSVFDFAAVEDHKIIPTMLLFEIETGFAWEVLLEILITATSEIQRTIYSSGEAETFEAACAEMKKTYDKCIAEEFEKEDSEKA